MRKLPVVADKLYQVSTGLEDCLDTFLLFARGCWQQCLAQRDDWCQRIHYLMGHHANQSHPCINLLIGQFVVDVAHGHDVDALVIDRGSRFVH